MKQSEPTLKYVIAWSERRNLYSLVADAIETKVGANDVRRLADEALAVFGAFEPSEIRDWLSGLLAEDESALVLEFERWSSLGPGVDSAWLMRRGH
ncbi:MAG: hypothetical protein E6I38_13385 [Chloroflexi bacterium]|nr:MAG: hypothetical protein E6I38_13385 [Chloroflexota bacterium]